MKTRKLAGWAVILAIGATLAASWATAQDAEKKPEAEGKPNIKSVSPDELKRELASYKGKVVLLNVWATWCADCITEFPHLVKLYNTYKDKDVVVLAISADFPEAAPAVRDFIQDQKAWMPVYMPKTEEILEFVAAIDPEFGTGLPATYVYDKNGDLVGERFVGGQSYETFENAIKKALQVKPKDAAPAK